MKSKDQELVKKYHENIIIESVENLFNSQALTTITPLIVDACYSVDRDEAFSDDTKVRILLTCIDLMSNLVLLSSGYTDYQNFKFEIEKSELVKTDLSVK